MVSRIRSATRVGIGAYPVDVETQIFGSLRRFSLVGLPDIAVRESKDRVRCAIESSGFSFPPSEVVVSLGPAALPKQGAGFDLAIALGILSADGQLQQSISESLLILGELSLNGQLKEVPGVLAAALLAQEKGFSRIILPASSAEEAALIDGVDVIGVQSLGQAAAYLNGEIEIEPAQNKGSCEEPFFSEPNFSDVVGQHAAKRALEIAAAGGHNCLFVGAPGAGKSMLAARLPCIMPPLEASEAIEVQLISSAANFSEKKIQGVGRPFRAPHHTTSFAGLIGGGSHPKPGEISLAHRGVLFLDELPEFRRDVLESLRQPLEAGRVLVSRAARNEEFPAEFLLIAAMNPCPCGRRGDGTNRCRCSSGQRRRYAGKISGPLLDRIDLQVWISPVSTDELSAPVGDDPTSGMRARVNKAGEAQRARFRHSAMCNARMSSKEVRRFCTLDNDSRTLIRAAMKRHALSARSYIRLIKVARTIADMSGEETIASAHLAEALSYRIEIT